MSFPTRRSALVGLAGAAMPLTTSIAAPAQSVRLPIAVVRNQPLVSLELNGRGPFTFLIDTGAGTFGITAAAAARAGLPQAGRSIIAGVSGGAVAARTWYARNVRAAGAIDFGLAQLVEFPGGGLDGYLPGNVLLAQPATFAFSDGEIRLATGGRADTTGYAAVPVSFDMRGSTGLATRASLDPHIVVEAELEGRTVRLAVDTGAQSAVALLPHASARFWDHTPALDIRVRGATGVAQGRLVKAGALRVGDAVTRDTLVSLTDPAATHVDSKVDGLLGMDMLRQLDMIVDAGRTTLWVRRNAAFGQPFRYDRSGLTLRSTPAGMEVTRVTPGSPGATASLAVGDVLSPARSMSREAFVWSLQDGPGVTVDMDSTRGGQVRPVRLVLKELL